MLGYRDHFAARRKDIAKIIKMAEQKDRRIPSVICRKTATVNIVRNKDFL